MCEYLQKKRGNMDDNDLAEFRKWVGHYVKLFGLTDYCIYVEMNKLESLTFAQTDITEKYGSAIITLNKKPAYKSDLKELARHEVLHIVCSPLMNLAQSREYTKKDIVSAHEREVIRLTNITGSLENDN